MNRKERNRITIMAGVKAKELSQVQAAEMLGLSYRQAKRVWRRYQDQGDAGLVHRLRGKPGLRHKPVPLRVQVMARCAEERYADFGPTLMAEELAKEGLVVDHDTLRRWLLAGGNRTVRRRRQQHRQWRERKPCFGAMVQLDGSHHDWFEGRRGKCVLMVMVDDATNRTLVRFFEEETTRASYDLLEGWVRQNGLLGALYVDRDKHLPLRRPAQRGGPVGGPGTANSVWPGDGATGGGADFGQQPASQGSGGTDERGLARSAGQGTAASWDQRSGKRESVFG
jgi:transposase